MKFILSLLLLLPLQLYAARVTPLQTIDLQKWSYVYTEIAPKIKVSCDCEIVTNADGSETTVIHKMKSLRQVGTERSCVVGSVSDFFRSMNGVTVDLLTALWSGGGMSWSSWDNGVTWYRIVPGNKYIEAPDPWCLP